MAGPNGAGKTTLVRQGPLDELLPRAQFLNADELTRELLRAHGVRDFAEASATMLHQTFVAAAERIFSETESLLRQGKTVCVETVLSTRKYCPLVEAVRDSGGGVFLIYVALRSPELAQARVRERVRLGGHDVPPEKVTTRWHRSLENLAWFAARSTRFWVFDNSDANPETPPQLLAEGSDGFCRILLPDFPKLTSVLKTLQH